MANFLFEYFCVNVKPTFINCILSAGQPLLCPAHIIHNGDLSSEYRSRVKYI